MSMDFFNSLLVSDIFLFSSVKMFISLVKFFIVERWFTMQNKDIVHKVVVRIKYNLY